MLSVFFHIEVYGAIHFISITFVHDFLNHFNLLHNMSGGCWFDAWFKGIEFSHGPMKEVGIFLDQFHGLQFFDHCLSGDFVFCGPAFFFEMPRIGNPYISDLVTQMHQVSKNEIKMMYGVTGEFSATVGPQTYMPTWPGTSGTKFLFAKDRI